MEKLGFSNGISWDLRRYYDASGNPPTFTLNLDTSKVFDWGKFEILVHAWENLQPLWIYESVDVTHKGLGKKRIIKEENPEVLKMKLLAQIHEWDESWKRRRKKEIATERTKDTKKIFDELRNILKHALCVSGPIDWTRLKDYSVFAVPAPEKKSPPIAPPREGIPREPHLSEAKYQPKELEPLRTEERYKTELSVWEMLSPMKKRMKSEEAESRFEVDHNKWVQEKEQLKKRFDEDHVEWERQREEIVAKNEEKQRRYEQRAQTTANTYRNEMENWESAKLRYAVEQAGKNAAVDDAVQRYHEKLPEAVADYCEMVLSISDYPVTFRREVETKYFAEIRTLVVEYSLPCPDDVPKYKEVKYNQSRDEFVEVPLSVSEAIAVFDDLLYQIVLRTIHELFKADTAEAIEAIVLNGWVKTADRATGKDVTACVLSLQTTRSEFSQLNLENVDAKACFRKLKGVGSSQLHSLTPIAPIQTISREDGRFVPSHAVASELQDSTNLASMDWEDFEHLIREVFEKEFSANGGEVKVTQASRDGGVDAVAFDPDPIRGGKIVIQAKRYTNTAGVSAVRDLFGTVMNEGATKGILVTTSDYGPDAYEFAKGKPLTLLSGANLLHLLGKHGHKARIDIKEAKKMLSEEGKTH